MTQLTLPSQADLNAALRAAMFQEPRLLDCACGSASLVGGVALMEHHGIAYPVSVHAPGCATLAKLAQELDRVAPGIPLALNAGPDSVPRWTTRGRSVERTERVQMCLANAYAQSRSTQVPPNPTPFVRLIEVAEHEGGTQPLIVHGLVPGGCELRQRIEAELHTLGLTLYEPPEQD